MTKKSIMFFGWLFYPKIGGAETILLNQARELVKRGYKVSVLTSVLNDEVEKEEKIFGIKVFRRKYVDPRSQQNESIIRNDVIKILNQEKPDIFHFHNGSYPSGGSDKSIGVKTILFIYKTIKEYGIPMVEHAHNAQLKNPETTKPLRDLEWDYLICVSDFVRKEWKILGTKAKKIKVVYNGIDADKFVIAQKSQIMDKIKKNGKVVLFSPARLFSLTTGQLNKQKNLALVFEALELLIKEKTNEFVLVSISNEVYGGEVKRKAKEKMEKMIKEKGLEGKVELIPVIDPDEMPQYYAGCDIVCVPALYETFGLMYLEAMAAGKVVIASNTGGPKEFIVDGENGYFVDPENAIKLATLLKTLINDQKLRERIGKNAAKDAKKYSVKLMVDKIIEIYKEIE
ncbi:MAG: glycosyltransferase family 4 protein [Candidatus Shapirobacteria bacterium]